MGSSSRGCVEGQLKDAFEARLSKKVPSDHAALAWLVEFVAVQNNRYEATTAGPRTSDSGESRRTCWGSSFVSGRCRAAGRMAKFDVSWQDGVFLGYRSLSGEVVVGTADGLLRTKRFAMETEPER